MIFDKLRSSQEKPLDLGVKLKNYKVKKAAAGLTPQTARARSGARDDETELDFCALYGVLADLDSY